MATFDCNTTVNSNGLKNCSSHHRVVYDLSVIDDFTKHISFVWRPCMSHRQVQGCRQGTTLSASDLHNARATIFNPFYNMECKIIKKIRQKDTSIKADIPSINATPNRYNPLPCHPPPTPHPPPTALPPPHPHPHPMNGTKIVLKSADRWLNIT